MKNTSIIILILSFFGSCTGDRLPNLDLAYENAKVFTEGDQLIISTGQLKRVYQLTGHGLATTGLWHISSSNAWVDTSPGFCDWQIGESTPGNLLSLQARVSDDEKFTNKHILVEAEFEYPAKQVIIKYTAWVYPGAYGLRTQLQLKAMPGYSTRGERFATGITETLRLSKMPGEVTAFGLMQGIKTNMEERLLRESRSGFADQKIDWASGLILSTDDAGIILVKESNKSTSLRHEGDVATGDFEIKDGVVTLSGAGMFPSDLQEDKYTSAWANWIVLYAGDTGHANLALKQFDRLRYPVHPSRDMFMMANTWGSEDMPTECIFAAREENVLKEIESVADLGIDILQIDEGWQNNEWLPASHSREFQRIKFIKSDYPVYPEGWVNVRRKADLLGVKLGLWAAWTIPGDKLRSNYDSGNFASFKLDFANLNSAEKRDNLMNKARDLIKYSNYNTIVNWDVTEIAPRAGYFYGREYGNIYLENRKINTARENVMYVPYKVLRDAWLLSKYVNLNKFQVTVQNIDMAGDRTKTDAHLHNHPYVVAIALMSSPIFFQETHYYTKEAREQIKPLLATYKKHREEMYRGYVFPIGDEPNNSSWTGFQNHHVENNTGYLLIFRELNNNEASKEIALKYIKDAGLKLTNLMTNETRRVKMNGDLVKFDIDQPAGYRFYRYEILD